MKSTDDIIRPAISRGVCDLTRRVARCFPAGGRRASNWGGATGESGDTTQQQTQGLLVFTHFTCGGKCVSHVLPDCRTRAYQQLGSERLP